jgi:hypothetical protein
MVHPMAKGFFALLLVEDGIRGLVLYEIISCTGLPKAYCYEEGLLIGTAKGRIYSIKVWPPGCDGRSP